MSEASAQQKSSVSLADSTRAKACGVKLGRPFEPTLHQQREALRRRDGGEETLADIGRSYNVSGSTISRLSP